MDLLHNIKSDRARQRSRQLHERSVFLTVSCIVKEYRLGEDFVRLLDHKEDCRFPERIESLKVKGKKGFEVPPFSLVSQEEYRLVTTITGRLGNPYLQFAQSPEEIILSAPLYRANPSISFDELLRFDFETLFLCQRAKEEVADLSQRCGNCNRTVGQIGDLGETRNGGSDVTMRQERIKQLQAFVATVGDRES
jgi:hypothetical protein